MQLPNLSTGISQAKSWLVAKFGGAARLQVILVLGAVLGLDSAEKGTISAVSDRLKAVFHISNLQVGLLLAVASFIDAAATLPMGILADRVSRRLILMIVVAGWAAAMVLSGTASSYLYLLTTTFGLGAVTAAAWPCIASLTGDFFPARERAVTFGLILTGELVGAGIGFFISGEISSFLDWRWAYYFWGLPSIALVWVMWRYLEEPARGGQNWLRAGEDDVGAAARPAAAKYGGWPGEDEAADPRSVGRAVQRAEVPPRRDLVLQEDPTRWGWWRTMRYLLKIPTYGLLIGASTCAYFFFAGVRSFAMIYFTGHYHLSRGVVSALVFVVGAGAVAGLMIGARISRRLLLRGEINARIVVPAVALFVSVPLLGVGFWTTAVWPGLLLMTVGTGAMASALAPIDAVRLDIVHPRMWGRCARCSKAVRRSCSVPSRCGSAAATTA